jgi:hypothetical protein
LRIANAKSELHSQQELFALPDNWEDPEALVLTKRRRNESNVSTKLVNSTGDPAKKSTASNSDVDILASDVRARSKPSAADSSRNLHASLDVLESILGQSVPGGHIKAGVMRFVSPDCEPKFSKYTGAAEP